MIGFAIALEAAMQPLPANSNQNAAASNDVAATPSNQAANSETQSATNDPPSQQPLALTCEGGGNASKVSGGMIYGNRGGWATITSRHDRGFTDQVDIRLFNGDDRIRMPRTMLPGIHGGEDGWFRLKNVVADPRSIHAEVQVSFINHPKLYIDRVTGTISISGKSGDYSGQCEIIDPNAPAKF